MSRPARPLVLVMALVLVAIGGCAPRLQEIGAAAFEPRLAEDVAVMEDGARLPLDVHAARRPRAVIVALHGFNGYANDFALAGPWLADHGVTVYAYDQRGFGRTEYRGVWPGSQRLVDDLAAIVELVGERHRGVPVYVMGTSMGGAVTMIALEEGLEIDGAILVAPAVWGWATMGPLYTSTLWVAAHIVPWMTFTGAQLEIWPTDNMEALRAYARDPLNIKATRVDAIYGLVSLMDEAYGAAGRLDTPVLFLYGDKDEIIPEPATREAMARITEPKRVVIYGEGWHMLLHDLQRERVYRDVLAWIRDRDGRLPSGEEVTVAPE